MHGYDNLMGKIWGGRTICCRKKIILHLSLIKERVQSDQVYPSDPLSCCNSDQNLTIMNVGNFSQ